jgi:hypothetical protein
LTTPVEARRLQALRAAGFPDAKITTQANTGYLDEILYEDGVLMRILPAEELRALDQHHLRIWCHMNGVYLIPSAELVEWISNRIAGRSALEIGAGNGALGRALGISMTDNFLQRDVPEVVKAYARSGHPPVRYGEDVKKRNANAAVRLAKPQVVVASWITHLYKEEEHERGGNMYGVDELKILDQVETYIHVGDANVHKNKRWVPTSTFRPDFLFGRGSDRVVQVWESE